MANVNVQLNGASIQVLDQNNVFRVNSPVGQVTLPGNTAFYDSFLSVATSPGTVLTLPATTVWVVYVNNLSGSLNLTVQLTVAGGVQISAVNSPVLMPGAVFMYWNPVENSGGITGVTLIGSATCPAEVLLAA